MESIYRQLVKAKESGEDLSLWLPSYEADHKKTEIQPGAWDGIMLYHMGKSALDEQEVRNFLLGICRRTLSEEEIEEFIDQSSALAFFLPLQTVMEQMEGDRQIGELIFFAVEQLEKSKKEEMVKFALLLLSHMRMQLFPEIKEKIRLFAKTDAFALYALLVVKSWESSDAELFDALKSLKGWGKVHAIELLEHPSEEMKEWLFLHGCGDDALCSYSALSIYQKAEVAKRIQRALSKEEFKALDTLLYHLMVEATRPGISALDDEEKSTFQIDYFMHLKTHASCLKDYRTALYTWDYYKNHEKIAPAMEEVFSSTKCKKIAEEALQKTGDFSLAEFLGLDYGEEVFAFMKEKIEERYDLGAKLLEKTKMVKEVISLFEEELKNTFMREKVYSLLPQLHHYPSMGKKLLLSALEDKKYRQEALCVCRSWMKKEDRVLASFFPESFSILTKLLKEDLSTAEEEKVKELLFGKMVES